MKEHRWVHWNRIKQREATGWKATNNVAKDGSVLMEREIPEPPKPAKKAPAKAKKTTKKKK